MTRPISDIDLEFLECITAVALDGNDLCKLLAQHLTTPAQLAVLQDVQGKFKRIRELVLNHKPIIAQSRLNRLEASYSPRTCVLSPNHQNRPETG